jgi:hypothetical protein
VHPDKLNPICFQVYKQSLPLEHPLHSKEMAKDEFLLHPPEASMHTEMVSKGPPLKVVDSLQLGGHPDIVQLRLMS